MDKGPENNWIKIFSEYEKKSRRTLPIKRNQLSLWLGRLIIVYNSLENQLATILMTELVDLIAKDEQSKKFQLGYIPPSMQRAWDCGLRDIMMATMPFKQKLDFLAALLIKRFSNNPEHQKHINQVAGLLLTADEFRNKMVHSLWEESYGVFSRVKVKTKGRKGLKIEREEADIKQLREAIDVIDFLKYYLFTLQNVNLVTEYNTDHERLRKRLQATPSQKAYPNQFLLPKT